MKKHDYRVKVRWTGNDGDGTKSYRSFRRDHEITVGDKALIPGSSDPAFRGDPARYNPEELLVASLSACHMLWYLHLCSAKGVVVIEYVDEAAGEMQESADGSGSFTRVVLSPKVTIQPAIGASATANAAKLAISLHHDAHAMCYIARSVNFPVDTAAQVAVREGTDSAVGNKV